MILIFRLFRRFLCLLIYLIPNLLIAQQIDTSYQINFKFDTLKINKHSFDWSKNKLRQEFILNGQMQMKYSIEIINYSKSILSVYKNNKWLFVDSIEHMFDLGFGLPSFRIMDFNKDGNQDLLCWVLTNVNGNYWQIIYLNDSKTNTLIKLENTSENGYIWDAPEYDSKDSTIHCMRLSGTFGSSFDSKYKLKNNLAIPLDKTETDNTQVSGITGKGQIIRDFVGENGKWKLTNLIEDK